MQRNRGKQPSGKDWRWKWQPTPVFLPGESQRRRSLVGCHLWGGTVGHNWSDLAAAAAISSRKLRDIKGMFHAKMGTIKDRNSMYLAEGEEIKKRWQEYTKNHHDPDNNNGVITHLEPDILKCEVKWALESIIMNKASGCDGIPVELFQILKIDAVKVMRSICQQIWKTQQWPQDWKRSVFIAIPKNAQTTTQLHSSHMLVK